MHSWKSRNKVALTITICALVMAWMAVARPGEVTNVEYLGGLLLLEILAAVLWNYRQRFFPMLILVFLLAGTEVPMQGVWGAARWLVLGVGALVGLAIYVRDYPVSSFHRFYWVALACVLAAATSAEASTYPKQPLLKALSLLLLFLYGSFGARLTILHREDRFVTGLLWGCEVLVYFAAVQYFILHREFFGNPNSLGAVMGVAVAPVMLWGMLVSKDSIARRRRGFALLLCFTLLLTSYSRAGIVAATAASVLLCGLLSQYRTLIRGLGFALVIAIVVASVVPLPNSPAAGTLASRFLFKGKEQAGVLASRKPVWETTVSSIQQHPWFGIGFGTALTTSGDDVDQVGNFGSSSITTREHGDSYLALIEGVGFLGVVPFACLVFITILNVVRVLNRLWLTKDPFSAAVPIAFILIAGFIHATFEDWLFAVGYYLCVFFWTLAFVLLDLAPRPSSELPQSLPRPIYIPHNDVLVPLSR